MGKSIYTKRKKRNESSESLVFSRRDINDMKIFIRFDKLENYSCDGTAFVLFLCLRLPRKFFFLYASMKVKKDFSFIYNHFLFSSLLLCKQETENPRG